MSSFWEQLREKGQAAAQTASTLANQAGHSIGKAIDDAVGLVEEHEFRFTEPRLGLTIEAFGPNRKALVTRVADEGQAHVLGVRVGDAVVSLDGAAVDDFDHLMEVLPNLERPCRIAVVRPKSAVQQASRDIGAVTQQAYDSALVNGAGAVSHAMTVVEMSLDAEIEKSVAILSGMTSPAAPDNNIPIEILREAQGLAFLRVAKGAAGFSARIGTGLVVARVDGACRQLINW